MEMFTKVALAFEQGGFWMWFIFAMQIISFAIIIERAIALYKNRKPTQKALALQFEQDIKKGDLDAVITRAQALSPGDPLGRAVVAGAAAARDFGGQNEIQGKMDEVLLEENTELEKRTGFLAMLGNVGTLAGLLGTIVGMIKSFAAVGMANPMEKATLLSQGISEAMNTTAYGLIMAIPALIMFAVLQSRTNTLSEDLNQGALKVFNWLSYAYEAIPARPARKAARAATEQTATLN